MNVLERDTREGGMKKAGVKRHRKKVEEKERQQRRIKKKHYCSDSQHQVHKFSLVFRISKKILLLPLSLQHHRENYLSDYGSNNYPAVYCR